MAVQGVKTASNDPLGEYGFLVEIPGLEIGYFAECTGIGVEYELLEHREGGNNEFVHLLRGRRKHTHITLKRGVTKELALVKWFNDVSNKEPPSMTISMYDEAGQTVRTFTFAGAIPIRWTGPSLTASSNGVATESLEIGHQGMVG